MISLEVPELKLVHANLRPDIDTNKAVLDNSNVEFPKRLVNRVELGVPISQPITAAMLEADQELRNFRNSKAATSDFYLIHLACTFHSGDGDPFHQAWLNVNLKRADKEKKERPIAWSMKPRLEGKDVKVTKELKLGGDLKLIDIGIVDIGVKSGSQRTTETVNQEIFIRAFGEQQSEPYWEFKKPKGIEILGSYRFAMVVQVPKGIDALAEVNAQATIKRKALGITYRTDLENAPQLTATMP